MIFNKFYQFIGQFKNPPPNQINQYVAKKQKNRLIFKLPLNFLKNTQLTSSSKILSPEQTITSETTISKPNIKLIIEKKYERSDANRNYNFMRKNEDLLINSNDTSLESLKELGFYDLREQNKMKKAAGLIQSRSMKESFEVPHETINNKDNNRKFIKGKYQINKGTTSLLYRNNNESSSDFVEVSYPENQISNKTHVKSQIGSVDLKNFLKKPQKLNSLYLLTQNNLALRKQQNLKVFKLSGNFASYNKINDKLSFTNTISNNFLEINSMKMMPLNRSNISMKINGNLSQKNKAYMK